MVRSKSAKEVEDIIIDYRVRGIVLLPYCSDKGAILPVAPHLNTGHIEAHVE